MLLPICFFSGAKSIMSNSAYRLLIALLVAPLFLSLAIWFFNRAVVANVMDIMDPDREQVEQSYTDEDIAFGGEKHALVKTYKRLRSIAASPADGRSINRTLSVAFVNMMTDRKTIEKTRLFGFGPETARQVTHPVEIDLRNAGTGAVLLIADRPVLWSPANVQPGQRAKIAVEGTAVFDLVNAPAGLLAGFRIGSFGAKSTTDPSDIDGSSQQRARLCASIALWSKHFNVSLGDVRMWRFTDPDSIALKGNQLESTGGFGSGPSYVTDQCPY